MNRRKPTIGLDRKLRLAWLDAVAADVKAGLPVREIRHHLDESLRDQLAGEGSHGARGKTITVLLRIWATPAAEHAGLRDAALDLLSEVMAPERLWLHWGMALATYPFFRDVAASTGRLLELQGHVALSQLTRRMSESWGQRSTLARAVQRVARSFIEWGVLVETSERGVYQATARRSSRRVALDAWLIEAALRSTGARIMNFRQVRESPALFPFITSVRPVELRDHPRLDIMRQGLDEELLLLRR